ncbi:MAG: ChaN family lipoprotein [Deltaproteobacteria bacterium]|nr:ChaN family lipoprotein [Deltaproteobacteria bacterium]
MPKVALPVLVVLVGCGGRYPKGPEKPAPMMKGGIEAAALPFQIIDRGGHETDAAAFWASVQKARAVCVGEDHPNPHHHWVQLHVVREVAKRLGKGDRIALGMEMFQKPFQGVVDDYAAKKIDAEALRSRAGWEERWGYDWGFYAPTIDAAVAAGGHLLALNAARELTKKVVRQGLEALTPEERAQVPELVLDDPAHRAWFDALMEGLGGTHGHAQKKEEAPPPPSSTTPPAPAPAPPPSSPHGQGNVAMPSADRVYTVQVMWDETMADGSAKWLAANPRGHLVILAGNGHCHDHAIVNRIKRRGVGDVISVRPVIDDGEGNVAEVLAKPMNDYVLVLKMPRHVERAHPVSASR